MHDWAGITAAAQVGGWVVYPLTLLAVLAIAIVIDRAYMFVRFASQPGASLDTLPAQHAFRRLDETVMVQAGTPLWLVEARAQSLGCVSRANAGNQRGTALDGKLSGTGP